MAARQSTQNRTYHEPSQLMLRTRELLNTTDKRQFEIYKDTGIQPNWLSRFAAGGIPDPSVNRIEALYNYLSGSTLTVE